ncbi:conjugal transfer pilin signal peptidase TrbI [Desulfacinum hydrothermale DSM 13146]|uniref:Signal peptidase I n=1 Tax=Desulfacinum hydrothermale DSM 13146 TaxID=1121390 RepID=A0A1W1XWF1_9BACT|nr:signal peptidase I [Desulfacinum hydrothermale]SMC28320.1 conjugal transfer pilin signal peptidase TrbI [Desulfacinum hydrothermale DSM 13146]
MKICPFKYNSASVSEWMKPRWRILLLASILLIVIPIIAHVVVSGLSKHYYIGVSGQKASCLPWSVILISRGKPATIQRGDIVEFIGRNMGHGFDGQHITKLVAGLPGDHILIRKGQLFVNGHYWDDLWLAEKLGKPVEAFEADYIVPPGKLFVLGTYYRSYDSRYWGMIDESEVIGTGTPLF